ncbi:receptor-like serine/threonine-protein kinase SD1-8 isoform X3 [Arachis ipaensis]|uniref:receptor-like serine/threonine-protein kinase SD1-8 isoform X3 n=1 Tax=Arachis ipaensis TaxID=130454 RepID=UPI000A2B0700|nr:receptor-like serine/threonine-protein kinase SD1-8 isoform X3 [Arachis ipaensis]XP_025681288.1 receptor-like serine/threonine-protein kinase SD1-8 isoform X1 [Arachis hypogaea]
MRIFFTHLNSLIILVISFFFFITPSTSLDTLTGTQILTTNQTLLSKNQTFVLGFFRGSNTNYYLGIWYNNINPRTIVWVANRDNPVDNSTGHLKIGDNGNFVLLNSSGKPAWSSNQTSAKNPVLQLLDTGNLVLKDSSDKTNNNYLWQSFDYPTDTVLPGMKIGWNLDTGTEKHLTSWKVTGEDPSSGDFTMKLDYHGLPEAFLRKNQTIIFRTGPWNGEGYSGIPAMKNNIDGLKFNFTYDEHSVWYSFSITEPSLLPRIIVTSDTDGEFQRYMWIQGSWNKFWYQPADQCDYYRQCGPYGVCDENASSICKCMQGFRPKNQEAWNLRDGSDGCVRNTVLNCSTDKFLHLEHTKLPETSSVFVNKSMTLDECGSLCKRNCSCTAYANIDIRNGGSGCVMWLGQLIDTRVYSTDGQDLYVRLAAADIGSTSSNKNHRVVQAVGITLILVLGLVAICYLMKKSKQRSRGFVRRSHDWIMNAVVFSRKHLGDERNMDDLELPMFDFDTLTMATNNFSQDNKLGEGGFGSVYRGRLIEGQEIAVKRLSKNSGQGNEEFKNEVKLIVKLQHRNLVRLLGCCIEKDEKMLVYEYMENRGLDSILFGSIVYFNIFYFLIMIYICFALILSLYVLIITDVADKSKKPLLDWERRFNIIYGIAKGLLYLHQDSRFRIIHRDLKTSNILLDNEMNPKISDFGMARIFDKDQMQAKTLRIVGTYGYMSPEYAMDGNFSIKSDVFSFGVMVLEIITGKKNRKFYSDNNELNLLGNVWRHWHKGTALTLIDPSIGNSYAKSKVMRCIHISLLCVQERAEDRPTMPSVVLMLSSEAPSMPKPKIPGFYARTNDPEIDSSSNKQNEIWSVNQVTITMLDAR